MDIRTVMQSKKTRWTLIAIAGLIVALVIFQLGAFVGFHKARFSYQWGDNYEKMFGGPRGGMAGGMMRGFEGRDFINGHGTNGSVVKVDAKSMIIKDADGVEKTITLTDKTAFRSGREEVKAESIKTNDRVVIIGAPQENGTIEAQIVRVFNPADLPPMMPGLPGPVPKVLK